MASAEQISAWRVEAIDRTGEHLVPLADNCFSQFGEDGLLAGVFKRIGTSNRCCFEVGASDGLLYSNTKALRDQGWRALLIEAEATLYEQLRLQESPLVTTVHERIGADSLDSLLSYFRFPQDLDFGSIDIDGADYWVWKGMTRFRPRVMLVEYGYFNPPNHIPAITFAGDSDQAGLDSIIGVGIELGYLPIVKTLCNVLFVDRESWIQTWESN